MSIAAAPLGERAVADQAHANAGTPQARRITAKADPVLQPEPR